MKKKESREERRRKQRKEKNRSREEKRKKGSREEKRKGEKRQPLLLPLRIRVSRPRVLPRLAHPATSGRG